MGKRKGLAKPEDTTVLETRTQVVPKSKRSRLNTGGDKDDNSVGVNSNDHPDKGNKVETASAEVEVKAMVEEKDVLIKETRYKEHKKKKERERKRKKRKLREKKKRKETRRKERKRKAAAEAQN